MNSEIENTMNNESNNSAIKNLETRITLLLEDKLWDDATKRCLRLKQINPENSNIPLFLLLIENKASNIKELLKTAPNNIVDNVFWKQVKATDSAEASELKDFENKIKAENKEQESEESVKLLKEAVVEAEKKRNKSTFDNTTIKRKHYSSNGHYLSIFFSFVFLLITFFYCLNFLYYPWKEYYAACQLKDKGKISEAIESFHNNKYFIDAVFLKNKLENIFINQSLLGKYELANKYFENKKILYAVETYRQLGFYKDSIQKDIESVALLNGATEESKEFKVIEFKEIANNLTINKEAEKKAKEETERLIYKEKAKKFEDEENQRRLKLEEKNRLEREKEETQEKIRAVALAKAEEKIAKLKDAEEEAKRLKKEAEKRRALLKVKQGTVKIIKVNGVDFVLIGCAKGGFWMGSHPQEIGRKNDELQHYVAIPQGFYIGQYEVTQAQYKAVTGFNPAASFIKGDNKPVFQISWFMAHEFCEKLNAITKQVRPANWHFDLPTEAQWEYACRSGSNTSFNNGSWINMNDCGWNITNTPARTLSDVARKRPNAWGLYDMHGSVWEWCKDDYGDYTDTKKASLDPYKMSGFQKVLRGGSYKSKAEDCRSARRKGSVPGNNGAGNNDFGFRIVLVID